MRSRRASEDGFTVVELTVALFLMGIVGAIMLSFVGSLLNATTAETRDSQAEKSIELTLRPMTEDVRGASSIATTYPTTTTSCPAGVYPSGYGNCLSFTVGRPGPNQLTCPKSVITYGLKSDGVIREDRTDYSVVSNACVANTIYTGKTILSGVTNGSAPLFTYYDQFGNTLNPSASGQTTLPFASTLTISVSVSVQYQRNTPLLSYTSNVALRNNR